VPQLRGSVVRWRRSHPDQLPPPWTARSRAIASASCSMARRSSASCSIARCSDLMISSRGVMAFHKTCACDSSSSSSDGGKVGWCPCTTPLKVDPLVFGQGSDQRRLVEQDRNEPLVAGDGSLPLPCDLLGSSRMFAPQEVKVAGVIDRSRQGTSPSLTGRDAVDIVKHVVLGAKQLDDHGRHRRIVSAVRDKHRIGQRPPRVS